MPATSLSISVATIANAALLTQLSIITFRETFDDTNTEEDMAKYVADEMNTPKLTLELEDKANTFFFAHHEGQAIGYAKVRTGKTEPGLRGSNPIELERIYVLKAFLDKKVGAALLSHCLAFALAAHHDVLWLGVWEHNTRAISFYKRWGFEFFGSHDFVLGHDVQTDLLMQKQL